MRTFAQLLFALLLIGSVKAYLNGGWGAVNKLWRLKVIGQ